MNASEKKLIEAWKQAAVDLQISVKTPFKLIDLNGNEIYFSLLIEGFGSKLGTLIITLDDFTHFDLPEEHGYYCSALNLKSYSKYNREDFIDTLEDWQYFGDPHLKPNWYSGKYENE